MRKLRKVCLILFCFILLSAFGFTVSAGIQDDYAPILYFEKEECCYPVDVSYLLGDNPLVDGLSNLKTIEIDGNTVYYIDNPAGTVNDDGVIIDYKNKLSQYGYTVYYTVNNSVPGYTFIQYWMFYAFNNGEHNRHEGDWEMVEVVIPSNGEKWVGYSQHYSGQRATWDLVEKQGDHIKVYVARGSHANYLRSYSGKLGIASDIVADNGKILFPDDYQLVELSDQVWLNYNFLWGEINDPEDIVTGNAGPMGPMFRVDMNGNYMWDGITWGSSLLPANELLFILEWFLYNFVTIFIILTILSLVVIFYRIYRRHKKYGLGPRILSMLYIDGFNLKSIGNILCFAGIIIAIVGLFNQWYVVSADINIPNFLTTGRFDLLTIDGINGVQVTLPSTNGFMPMGNVFFPFSLIIFIGFVFMILGTIGLHLSRKLGKKYLYRGIKLILVIIVLILAIMAIGLFTGSAGFSSGDNYFTGILNAISSNPFSGTYAFSISESGISGQVSVDWSLGLGAILIFLSGFIFVVAGVFEIVANKTFFEPKTSVDKPKKPGYEPPESSGEFMESKS